MALATLSFHYNAYTHPLGNIIHRWYYLERETETMVKRLVHCPVIDKIIIKKKNKQKNKKTVKDYMLVVYEEN